jgi:hypothetical protein
MAVVLALEHTGESLANQSAAGKRLYRAMEAELHHIVETNSWQTRMIGPCDPPKRTVTDRPGRGMTAELDANEPAAVGHAGLAGNVW